MGSGPVGQHQIVRGHRVPRSPVKAFGACQIIQIGNLPEAPFGVTGFEAGVEFEVRGRRVDVALDIGTVEDQGGVAGQDTACSGKEAFCRPPWADVNHINSLCAVVCLHQSSYGLEPQVRNNMKAIAYVRWSSKDQKKGDSERRQTSLAAEMCQTRGWTLVETVIEHGKSAYHGRNRSKIGELGKLEKRAANGELAGMALIVENVDRLSRQEPIEGLLLLQSLTKAGVTVAESASNSVLDANTVKENWQSLLVPFLRWGLSYEESHKKGLRISEAYQSTLDRGFRTKDGLADLRFSPSWIGRDDAGDYQIIEDRADIVRLIYKRCVDGHGLRAICAELNKDLSKTRWQKGDWNQANIREILRNRQSLGEYELTERTEDNYTRRTGQWVKGNFPSVIDAELWHRAQSALDARRSTGGKRRGMVNLLQGFTYCGAINDGERCGSRMIITQNSKTEPRKARLRCARNHRAAGCNSRASFHYQHLLNGILNQLLEVALPVPKKESDASSSLAVAQVELEGAEKRLDNLVDAFAESGSPALKRGIARAEADIEEQRQKLEELRIALEKEQSKRPAQNAIDEIQTLRDQLQEDEDARRKVHSALQEMITSVFLYPDTREAHVLVAGIHALRFDGLGNLIDSQVATSAVLEGAHNDNPIGLQRYLDYTKNG